MTVKTVVVTPGRVAFTTPQARTQFTDKPTTVIWNDYLEELLTVHGDIHEVVSPDATPSKTISHVDPGMKIKLNTINTGAINSAS